jgi:hypothetical protein
MRVVSFRYPIPCWCLKLMKVIKIYCDYEMFKTIKEEFLEITFYGKKIFSKTTIIIA